MTKEELNHDPNLKTDDFDYFCINCNKWIDLIGNYNLGMNVTCLHNHTKKIIRIIDLYDSGYYCHSKLIVENC